MRTKLLLAAALAALALPATARADSLAYVKDGDVWLSTTDGAREARLTRDGGWTGVSQSDDGVVVGAKDRRLFRLGPSGGVRNEIATAMKSLNWNGPYDIAVSPDGTRVAYGFLYQRVVEDPDCPFTPSQCASTSIISGVAYSSTDGPAAGVPAHTGWSYPAWVGDGLLMHSDPDGVLDEDVILRAYGSPNNEGDQWFSAESIPRLRDGEIRGNVLAFIGGHSAEILTVWRTAGRPGESAPEGCLAYGQPTGGFSSPSLAPDARTLVWAEGDGIWSAPLPDLGAGCGGTPQNGRLIVPGGSYPDWGCAALPAPARPSLRIAAAPLARALERGLAVTVRGVAGTVELTGRAGGRVVARGAGPAGRPVRLGFTRTARRRLSGARKVRLTVAVAGGPRRAVVLRR